MAQALMLIGAGVSVASSLSQGKVAQQSAKMQAAQLAEAAKVEEANAQRAAGEERRQAALVQSRARAIGAASGAGDYEGLLEQIDAEGEYRALFELYNGQQSATGMRNQATMTKFEGNQARTASRLNAGSTILQTGATMQQKYG